MFYGICLEPSKIHILQLLLFLINNKLSVSYLQEHHNNSHAYLSFFCYILIFFKLML